MNFVVIGCGRFGSTLAYRLYQKGHQVGIVDKALGAFEHLPADFRGKMVEGEGLSRDALQRAGIESADGLAAVTDSDPVNLAIAHIARVVYHVSHAVAQNNDPAWRVFYEAFGIEIVSPASWGARRVEELLHPNATPDVLPADRGAAAEIERAPFGDAGATPESRTGRASRAMFVIIAGGELTGSHLATRLLDRRHRALLIEDQREVLARIHRELPTEAVFEGNAAMPPVLEQAGIREADVLVAFTQRDSVNLVLCYVAHQLYGVPRTIARINDPRNGWLFDEKFDVDVALDQTEILAHLIEEETSMGDMMTLLKLRRGEYALVEQHIPEEAKAIGIPIKDLALPDNCVITAIIRDGQIVVPRGGTIFQAGDEVLALTNSQAAEELARLFAAPQE
jgi:trk system potassium uptake protein TrkA